MHKRTTFFTILLCLQGLLHAESVSPFGDPQPKITIELPCNLPAPANIAWSFPTASSVLVTWSNVPGAWGFLANLSSNSGNSGGVTQSNSMLFSVLPNVNYTFTVQCMCDAVTTSPFQTTVMIPSYIVITDILIDRAAPCSNLTQIPDLVPISGSTIDYVSDIIKDYYLRFTKNNLPYDLYMKRINTPQNPMSQYKFELRGVIGQNSQINCGLNPLLGCTKAVFSGGGAQVNIQMSRIVQAGAIDQIILSGNTFDSFALYYCTGGNAIGGDDRDKEDTFSAKSYAVSPFHDYLQIVLDSSKRLKSIRMMDISGRLAFEQSIPDYVEFSDQLILPTTQLAAGLYILQLQAADGKVEIFKVVKD